MSLGTDWYKLAVEWIKQELPRLGYGSVTRIEQGVENKPHILRVHIDHSIFYFKAVPNEHWLANEPVIATELATRYPHLIPKPICIDAERRWMITPEFGSTLEKSERDEEMLVQVAHTYGQMQLDSIAHLNLVETDTWGCNLTRLPITWETYVHESKVLKELETKEVDALQLYVSRIKDDIQELVGSPIPQTIVHGDLGPYNIAQHHGKPIVFDWTHIGISFPFFDMVELFHRVRPLSAGDDASIRTPEVDAIKERMKAAYLSAWTDYASLAELEKLWIISEPLGFVSMALHLPFPYFPRRVLQYFEES
jgi:hypothetical protein